MSRKTEDTNKKPDWMIYESDWIEGQVKIQVTYVTGDKEGTIGYGQVVFKDIVAVKVGIVHSKGGNDFFSFPSKKGKDGEWYSDVIPQNKTIAGILKEAAEDAVDFILDEYEAPEKEEKKSERKKGRR